MYVYCLSYKRRQQFTSEIKANYHITASNSIHIYNSYVHLKKSGKKSRFFFGYFFGYFSGVFYVIKMEKNIQKNIQKKNPEKNPKKKSKKKIWIFFRIFLDGRSFCFI